MNERNEKSLITILRIKSKKEIRIELKDCGEEEKQLKN